MKYDPVSLFEIKVYHDEKGEPFIDLACSRPLLEHCMAALQKNQENTGVSLKEDAEIIEFMASAIAAFANRPSRAN